VISNGLIGVYLYISGSGVLAPELICISRHNPLDTGERPRKLANNKIVALKTCDKQKSTCGTSQPIYRLQQPHTRFQQKAREHEDLIKDLQHFTQTLKAETVARYDYLQDMKAS
jgi:hypothetical protein